MEKLLLLFCNWSTLGVCAALKLPQISAVLAARSARGISLPSLLLELAGFLVFLRYQCYYEYPLLTYLEYPILIAQDVLLLLCAFHFNGNVKGAAPYMAVFVASWFVLPLQKWIIDLAMNLSTFISVASKFAQLQYLWKTRDSGTVSALTWSLAAYTCATRIITTIMTTGDLTILTRFVIMLALNVWVTTTVLRYRKTAVKAE
ncbi:solute carrier family 66 member 3 isoform X3 [Prionailurus viverrinus]|uniref:Solute carrier family 66 member 3 n=1 Tax=Lynx canadensis TaxID=61383 RepID=A0A667G9L2_LYNCA|nr:solute carrier family 66 member 3 isoform X1 [Lynx canadensis]XP_042838429.1 solute carrier family 66 member 3 isoform X3 [Panthera tigris]XP_044910879.1 solute carrier family 66 member 3 isoform X2 [Felis catus]XP_045303668.1 solute carrier family 66 member 3 isoform X1 [Leopardus geoffroyi]XP_047701156.1 solute carrier family 66 member 3 isoform X3 [Prionailurus viverrinus]XP_049508471.1 solute carrier family 66 member 3 isoform X1 [Panthera uncia]